MNTFVAIMTFILGVLPTALAFAANTPSNSGYLKSCTQLFSSLEANEQKQVLTTILVTLLQSKTPTPQSIENVATTLLEAQLIGQAPQDILPLAQIVLAHPQANAQALESIARVTA